MRPEKKIQGRKRRSTKARMLAIKHDTHRLVVFRSAKHIYAQITTPSGDRILASASTLEKQHIDAALNPKEKATVVGKVLAERAKDLSIEKLMFDRSGYKYHGRVKALAESAREHGLQV